MSNGSSPSPEAIRHLRARLAMTQEEFARVLGVTWSTVSRWENGASVPSKLATNALTALAEKGATT